MARLLVLLLFASLHSISAHEKRGIVETTYHPSHHNIHNPQYYAKDPSTPDQDASKATPVIVSLPPSSLSSYHVNQQFPTVSHPIEYQASAQVPYSIPHQGVVPYSNQYIVKQPYQNQHSNLYIPFNQFQQLPAQLNTDFTKNVPAVQSQTGHKIGSIKSTPLYHHQVYHPLHTSVQLGNLKTQQGPQTFQQQNSPPTPPKIYRNFHPIIPTTPVPVQHPLPVQHPVKNAPKEAEEQESNEEINEEEENERQEEEHEDQREEVEDEEEHFRPEKFFSGRFHEDDEDHGRYRTHEDEEDHEDRYSESRPSKQSSKYRYPEKKYNYKKSFSPFKSDPDFESFRGFKEPKVEYKMYKYSKSSNKPERKEYIEGKGSENVPVVQHSQKSYKEQWVISSETSSMSNE